MKRIASALLAITLCISLSVPAFAEEGEAVHATVHSPEIIVEGVKAGFLCGPGEECEPITYNGTVYIPLYTAGLWLGADAACDGNAVTVARSGAEPVFHSQSDLYYMDVKQLEDTEDYINGVDAVWLTGAAATVDGRTVSLANALGEPVYPLLFREKVYLPVRSVAGWMGKQVQWVGNAASGTVYIYAAPTQETLAEANAYIAAVRGRLNTVRTLLEETYVVHSDEEFYGNIRKLKAELQAAAELPEPAFQGAKRNMGYLRRAVLQTLCDDVDPWLPAEEKSGAAEELGLIPRKTRKDIRDSIPETRWMSVRSDFVSVPKGVDTAFLSAEEKCANCEELMSVVNAAAPTAFTDAKDSDTSRGNDLRYKS